MKYKELTEKIIGLMYKVYNKLGYGFSESVYEKALLIEYLVNPVHPVKEENDD